MKKTALYLLEIIKQKILSTDLGKRLTYAVSWSVLGSIGQKIFLLATSFFCMHILGKEGYGRLNIIRSTIQVFILLGAAGMGGTATKFISQYRDNNRDKLTGTYTIVNITCISLAFIISAVVICFASQIADYLEDPGLINSIRLGALLLFFSIINSIQIGILSGVERFKAIAIISVLGGIVEFICINLGALYYSVPGALVGYAGGFVFITAISEYYILKDETSFRLSTKTITLSDIKEIVFFTLPNFGASLLVSPVTWFSQALLLKNLSYAELGIYTAADQWRMVLLFIPGSISRITLPVLSNTLSKNDIGDYKKILKINLEINFFVTSVFYVFFLLFTPLILFGYKLELSCFSLFAILNASVIFTSLANVFGQAIISCGKTHIGFLFNLFWGIMVVSFTYVFLRIGLKEVALALAYLLSYLFHTLFQGIYFFRFIKNNLFQTVPA